MLRSTLAVLAASAAAVLAKTDIGGCTYYDGVFTPSHGYPYATRIWYVEDTGELCEILDCGGGRAPPKTTVPGCAAYEGTATYEPRFIDPATLGDEPITTDIVGTVRRTDAVATETSSSAAESTSAVESESQSESESEPAATETASITKMTTTPAPETGSRTQTPGASQTSSSAEETEIGAPDNGAGVVGAKAGLAAVVGFVAVAGLM